MNRSDYENDFPILSTKPLPLIGGAKEKSTLEISGNIKRINAENSITVGGCRNQYQDCFVNALCNGLANTEFRQHIINIDTSNRNMPVTKRLKTIFQQMELGVQNINTRQLRYSIEQYRDKEQHDICLFYQDLLLKLIEEEIPQNQEVQNESETKLKYQTKYDEAIQGSEIRRFFTWLIEKPFTCNSESQCGVSNIYYAVECLRLQIPPGDGPFSLEDCIQQSLFKPTDQNNKPKCPECGIENDQNVNVEVIKIIPPVPIIQLGRSEGRNNVKIQTEIEYNNAVVLNNQTIPLAAVLNHHGEYIDSGHYTTYVRGTRRWIHVNDTNVFPVNSLNKSEAYTLIFSRQPNESNEQTILENSVRVLADTIAQNFKAKNKSDTTGVTKLSKNDEKSTGVDEPVINIMDDDLVDVDKFIDENEEAANNESECFTADKMGLSGTPVKGSSPAMSMKQDEDIKNADNQSESGENTENGGDANIYTEKDQVNEEVVINLHQHSEFCDIVNIDGDGHCLFNSIGSALSQKLSAYEVRHMIYVKALQRVKYYSGLTNSWPGYGDNAEEFEKKMKENLSSIQSEPPIWGNINDLIIGGLILKTDIYSYNSLKNDITAYSAKKGILNKSNFIVLHYDGLQHYEIIIFY